MSGEQYLRNILAREYVDTSPSSPIRGVHRTLTPLINDWAGTSLISMSPSGSFAKGTANSSGTDIDLFIYLSSSVTMSLKDIYNSLANTLNKNGYIVRKQNVSLGITVNGYDVDLVPAKRQGSYGNDHSLYRRRVDTWTKTNVSNHIALISGSGRTEEIRIIKLWRKQQGIDFLSFYLELTVIEALRGKRIGDLENNVQAALLYIRDRVAIARVVDPANSSNVLSDDMTTAEKTAIASAARDAAAATTWGPVVR